MQFAQCEEGRRKLIRGAWIRGFLERRMIHRAGVGLSKMTAMYTVHPVLCCEEFVCNPQPVLLPVLLENSKKPSSQASSNTTKAVVKQNGRGCQAKPMSTLRFQIQKSCLRLEAAMSTSFLVFFTVNTPKRLSYTVPISQGLASTLPVSPNSCTTTFSSSNVSQGTRRRCWLCSQIQETHLK